MTILEDTGVKKKKKKVIRDKEKMQLRGQNVGWLIYWDDKVSQSDKRNFRIERHIVS